ncbi:MAG: M14 family metallopeptidase, partial [Spirochaetes bacterium]|nr:M14 family metallopeptidase [Spirochaetota bacterium]
ILVGWSTFKFNSLSFDENLTIEDKNALDYYLPSYEKSRDAFRAIAFEVKKKYYTSVIRTMKVPSNVDNNLFIDILYIPQTGKTSRLLVLSSGVHGIEGFVGSAIQRMFLNEFLSDDLLKSMGVLLLHAMNPYGFKYFRRVTENNVDLNRNCDISDLLYTTKNAGYPKVSPLINPNGVVKVNSFGNIFFHIKAIVHILQTPMRELRQAILQGQYEFPRGVYYGGKEAEPQVKLIASEVKPILNRYRLVFNIDLHTGYGSRGVLHLFPNPIQNKEIKSKVEKIFNGYPVDWGDTENFYTVTGDFSTFLGKLMTKGEFLPMTFEYGTLNSDTTLGSIKSLHITILENQGYQYGYASKNDEVRVKANFLEMFFPSSPFWRVKIMNDTRKVLKSSLENFKNL